METYSRLLVVGTLALIMQTGTCGFLQAQDNTMYKDPDSESPPAALEDVAWLAGHWRGEQWGGIIDEVWSSPLGNSMMGMFRLVVDGKVKFYEFVTITEERGTLMLRLKHFHGNLKGWEEKDETIDFPLVTVSPDKVYFDGITLERVSGREMNVYVELEDADTGERNETTFRYERVGEKN